MNYARWDGDSTGHGIASGTSAAPSVQKLLDALHLPDWVTEDPDAHLRPHLQRAVDAAPSVWSLHSGHIRDDVYVVTLEWLVAEGRMRDLRADVFTLAGAVAEGTTCIRAHVEEDVVVFDIVTGTLDGDGPFKGHGHMLQLRVEGDAAARAAQGTRQKL